MDIINLFDKIRIPILARTANTLARGSNVREGFSDQLNRFFDLVGEAIATGDTAWIDPLLQVWATTKTETDLDLNERAAAELLNNIIQISCDTIHETLDPDQAVEILCVLMPIYTHCITRVAALENESRIAYLAKDVKLLQNKIEKLDRSKSNFVSVAAHEFKTPLTIVEGYSAMLKEQLPGGSEQVQALLSGMHNGINRLRELVDDMIDVSLLDNNMMKFNFQPVWLNRIFNLLRMEFQPTFELRGQKLIIGNFDGANDMIFSDPERIYQAFKNIISNAIKYTPDTGTITIDGRKINGFVEITISDTGIGIAADNQDAIFEKFGQLGDAALHSSGKTKFKGGGPGLGLPITKGIIEAHGGSIWVESEEFNEISCPGSTFHILLPLKTQPTDSSFSGYVNPLKKSTRAIK